jgi:hypothetical protein
MDNCGHAKADTGAVSESHLPGDESVAVIGRPSNELNYNSGVPGPKTNFHKHGMPTLGQG